MFTAQPRFDRTTGDLTLCTGPFALFVVFAMWWYRMFDLVDVGLRTKYIHLTVSNVMI